MKINENYKNLSESYLFSTIAKKVAVYTQQHPEQEIIRLGIGDVTLPLAAPVVDALHAAVEEMGKKETFHGYGPEQGYGFLKQALMRYYARRGVVLAENEIFVGDGAKSDIGNILDLFDVDNTVLVPDPVYPVYVDTNVMAGAAYRVCGGHAGKRFSAHAAGRCTGGPDLPVQPQQPHGRGVQPGSASGVGGLCE